MTPIRVLLADDHVLVRAAIRALVQAITGVVVVGEAGSGREALALAKAKQPDIVMMDISMHDGNGIEATAWIRAEVPATRVMMLSMHCTQDFVRRSLNAGACGYLVKDSAALELGAAIAAAMRDEVYVSSRAASTMIGS
jgi:DNA-binding NarL/FixJ family response regulator